MIDGATSKPFSAKTTPIKEAVASTKEQIIFESRKMFGMSRAEVEQIIFTPNAKMHNKKIPEPTTNSNVA